MSLINIQQAVWVISVVFFTRKNVNLKAVMQVAVAASISIL